MAANYRYDKNSDNTFYIKERMTGLTIKNGMTFDKAQKMTKSLNSGGGFDGLTPDFFVSSNITVSSLEDEA